MLEALRDLTSPRALMIRGHERRRIAGREIVRGDILLLAECDRIPALKIGRCGRPRAVTFADSKQ